MASDCMVGEIFDIFWLGNITGSSLTQFIYYSHNTVEYFNFDLTVSGITKSNKNESCCFVKIAV